LEIRIQKRTATGDRV